MREQSGGGSFGQSLKYVDPTQVERSAPAGVDLLKSHGLIARPAIGGGTRKRKGGFYPSVMAGVVDNAMISAPLAAFAARKLFSRKTRKGGGKKGNLWRAQQQEARASLIGALAGLTKPTAQNITKYAAAKRQGDEQAEAVLNQIVERKRQERNQKRAAKASKKQARNKERAVTKAAKKAEKNAEKAAAKAAKEAEKAAKREAAAAAKAAKATKKVRKPKKTAAAALVATTATGMGNGEGENGSYRPPTALQLKREAEENAARARAEMEKAKRSATRKAKKAAAGMGNGEGEASTEGKKAAWNTLVATAKQRLLEEGGKPTLKDSLQLASLMKENKNTTAFLNEYRARTRKASTTTTTTTTTAAPKSRKAAKATATATTTTTAAPRPRMAVKPTATTTTAAPRPRMAVKPTETTTTTAASQGTGEKRVASEAQQKYYNALRKRMSSARNFLQTIGRPTGANMSQYAKLVEKDAPQSNRNAWLENFKSRRPLTTSAAASTTTTTTSATKKPRTAKASSSSGVGAATAKKPRSTKKALSVVQETTERSEKSTSSENNMQGYSEDFESEPEDK